MKFNKWTLLAVLFASLLIKGTARADVPTNNVNTAWLDTVDLSQKPTFADGIKIAAKAAGGAGIFNATNYAIEPYFTYANKAPQGDRYGGGLFVAYNLSDNLSSGIGVDYLGRFSLVSANAQLKLPVTLGDYLPARFKNTFLGTVKLTPFALAGIGKGMSGDTSSAIAITDVGAYISFGHLLGGRFNLGACYGRWDNAGIYSGPREHVFAGWSLGF